MSSVRPSSVTPKSKAHPAGIPVKPSTAAFTVEWLQDFIYSTYNSLLDAGWRMQEIDQMDMLGFLKVRAWNSNRAKEKTAPKARYIDEVWPSLKP